MKTSSVEEAVAGAMKKIVGAYSLVVMSPRKMIGARDPFGFKPLCIGKRDNAYILVSESCALDTIGAEFVRCQAGRDRYHHEGRNRIRYETLLKRPGGRSQMRI